MKFHLILFSTIAIVSGCKKQDQFTLLSSENKPAESVYLTHDQNNNPVVVWTEKHDDGLKLFFATSSDNGESFIDKKVFPLGSDVATHAEGMPKLAFKKDGTIVAVYEKRAPTNDNKYAGAIYYISSGDGGKTWMTEKFLHSDTVTGRSRSYFDIERLSNGEIGASWLDIKLDDKTDGRSVRFASTFDSSGFTNEILLDSSACQCCRIDVYCDIAGQVNVAYRGLARGLIGQSIRDMMLATSHDNGTTFDKPIKISKDNWVIEGCPHTGPSLCSTKSGICSLWYTEGNGTGIYYSFKNNSDNSFDQRKLVSNSGHHPQASANGDRLIMIWEENTDSNDKKITRLIYQTNNGQKIKKEALTPTNQNAFVPVVTQVSDGFLVAFLMENKNSTGMYITKIKAD